MPQDHVATLRELYRLFYNEKRFAEGATLLAEGFVNHHPGSSGPGRQAVIDDFTRLTASRYPDFHVDPIRMLAEKDYVWALSLITGIGESSGLAVDIWRFEDEVIAEHWDFSRVLRADEDPRRILAGLVES